MFNNVCYGSWANVEATANAAANADAYALKVAVNKAVAGGNTDQAKKDAGFYAYKPTASLVLMNACTIIGTAIMIMVTTVKWVLWSLLLSVTTFINLKLLKS